MKKSELMSMAAAMMKSRWMAGAMLACTLLTMGSPVVAQTTAVNRAVVNLPAALINPGVNCAGNGRVFDASGNGSCSSTDSDPVLRISVGKTALPATGSDVLPGSTISHRVTPRVEHLPTGGSYTATTVDTLPKGVTLVSSTLPTGCTAAAGTGGTTVVTCAHMFMGTGAAQLEYLFTYQTTVDANASGSLISEASVQSGYCNSQCTTTHNVTPSSATYSKIATLPGGKTTVDVGDTLTYTLTATVAGSITTDALVLTDTLGTGLTFGSVTTNTGGYTAGGSGQVRTFTLPAGTLPGTYTVTYTATVNTQATGTVKNAVVGSGGDNGGCATTGGCGPETPVTSSNVTYAKTAALPGGKTTVAVGDVLTYTLTATVAGSSTTEALVLTDTLGTGLTYGSVTANTGGYTAGGTGQVRTFTLPIGTVPGTYAVTYTATVNNQATGTVNNAVVGSGDDDGGCATPSGCDPDVPVTAPSVTYAKAVVLPSGKTTVAVGDVLTYTLTATVANSTTTDPLVLTDTLGTGLTFGSVGANTGGYTTGGAGQVRTFTLPVGKVPGTYTVTYTATVNTQASGSVNNAVVGSGGNNGGCATAGGCDPDVPVTAPSVTYSKGAALPSGKTTVAVGDTLTYTLTATVSGSATTSALVLTDTLGTGLTFGSVGANTGGYTTGGSGQVRTFTLPVGKVPGTYAVTYTAIVNNQAAGTVNNAVVGSGGNDGGCATAGACDPDVPVTAPSVTYVKAAALPGGKTSVVVGDTITYTLTATVTGSATTDALVLTDTLGTGLTFGTVTTNAGGYTNGGTGQVRTFTLPVGKVPGTYTVTYTATVNAQASGTVNNAVVGGGDNNGGCATPGACDPDVPVAVPTVTYNKIAALPSGKTSVVVGDTVTYTLTATVANSATTDPLVLTDTMGTGLTFGSVSANAGGYAVGGTGQVRTFTLPVGKVPGTYTVTYTATVNDQASVTVNNAVVGSGGNNGGCATPGGCDPDVPVTAPSVSYTKAAALPSGKTTVAVGDTITYTLTATVTGSATTDALVLTDTLGTGLTFGTVTTNAGGYTAGGSGQVRTFTLPVGKVPGTYTVTYTATVNNQATGTVNNAVVGSGDNDGGCATAGACDPDVPVTAPSVSYMKAAVLPSGKINVEVGDVLTYTLTATVTGSATTSALVLTDTLGTGLTFGSVGANAGGYTTGGTGQVRTFTLPVGKVPGTYTVTYTATVNNQATGTVNNAVVGSGDNNGGCATPGGCDPDVPVAQPGVSYAKSAALPSGKTAVAVGDTITYTLTATVTGSVTTDALVLTDTLGTGLTFGSVGANAGGYTTGGSGQVRTFTLPSGKVPGTYAVTYTATVNSQATGTVNNAVVGSGGGNNGCATPGGCDPDVPVAVPGVTYAKSVVLPNGKTTVAVGDTLTYTLTATVTGSATTDTLVLTDTLGTGLTFGSVGANAGGYTTGGSGQVRTFTLPIGKVPGTYTVTYTATVNTQANGSVNNAVVGSGGNSDGCTTPGGCTPDVPVTAPSVTYSKAATLPSGKTTVAVGDTITYTLTATVTGSATTSALVLTDTLGTGLTFGSVTANTGGYTAGGSGQVRTFTLPVGKVPGTYTVTYTATVNNQAANTVNNAVVGNGGNNGGCATPGGCDPDVPVTAPSVSYTKAAALPSGKTTVAVGDTITYTLTATVTGSATTSALVLTDTLGTGLTFGSVGANTGGYTTGGTGQVRTFTLPIGKVPGTYAVTYTAIVNNQAAGTVNNAVVGSGSNDGGCVSAGACDPDVPVTAPSVTYTKNAALPSGKISVEVGDVLTYTLTATVSGSATTSALVLTDTLGTGLTYGAVTANTGGYTTGGTGQVRTFTLPVGKVPGTYTVTYTATVNAQATGTVNNAVVGSGSNNGGCATVGACDPDVPVAKPGVSYAKSAALPSGKTTVDVGDTITYTLTAVVTGSVTTDALLLTDTLGTGLTFGSVTANSGGYATGGTGQVRTFTLTAGKVPGTYAVTYTATVNAQASGTVNNAVVGSGGGDPECVIPGACDPDVPVSTPKVTYAKSAVLPSGKTTVDVGDTMTYTLTATVTGSATTDAVVLTDTLGTGLTFGAVTANTGGYTTGGSGQVRTFTLPVGKVPGTYTVTYTATVNTQAQGSVNNAVVGSGGNNGGCTTPGGCTPDVPVSESNVTYTKVAVLPSGKTTVDVGDSITYTLTATVSGSATTDALVLTDTLGTGLTFGSVSANTGGYAAGGSGQVRTFTLAAGTVPGTYAVTYTAAVNTQAQGSVNNAVVGSGGDNGGCATPGGCVPEVPVSTPSVTYAKSAVLPNGKTSVAVGDTIPYTLTATVSGSATTDALVLTDTLGTGLTFGSVTANTGGYAAGGSGQVRTFTLAAGTVPGTYAVTYTAVVNDQAAGRVNNAVVGSGDDNGGCATPGGCTPDVPVSGSNVTYAKTAVLPNGKSTVDVGDTMTYTLTAVVTGSMTSDALVLTDTLGTGLTFGSVTANTGGYATGGSGQVRTFTLAAGTVPGTYAVTYTAVVNDQAVGRVNNAVVGNGGDNGGCATPGGCVPEVPVTTPNVTYAKTAVLPSGKTTVDVGDTMTYTLTAVVTGSRTRDALVLTDTLGTGLTYGAVTANTGSYTEGGSGQVRTFTLAAGTVPGTYAVTYIATVNEQAVGRVNNAVVGSGGDNGGCTTPGGCVPEVPVSTPNVTYNKSAVLPSGKTTVDVGDTMTYTLTATVSGSATTDALVLTDTLGTGLTYGAVTANTGGYAEGGSGQVRTFTLAAGTVPGTYAVTYTAVVNDQAVGRVNNAVVGSGGDNGGCATPGGCVPEVPVTTPNVTYAKSAVLPSGKSTVDVGDTMTYTLTAVVTGSRTRDALVLTDTLGTGLTFGAVTANTGGYAEGGSGQVRTFTLVAGTVPGTYAVTYTATVNDQAVGRVNNAVVGSGGDNGGCATPGGCVPEVPVTTPNVTYAKSAVLPNGKTSVAVGDTMSYTLTAVVTGSKTTEALVLTDTLGTGLTFGSVTANTGGYAEGGSGQVRTFTLAAGTVPGTYAVTYTAVVNDQAAGRVNNAVVGDGGDNGGCVTPGGCTPDVPVTESNVTYAKTVVLPAGKTGVMVGDTLSYTLTAVVTGSMTSDALVLTDTLGSGLTFGTVIANSGGYTEGGSGQVRTFTLAAGTVPGTYAVTYTAIVNSQASGSVSNAVVGGGGDNGGCSNPNGCTPQVPLLASLVAVPDSYADADGAHGGSIGSVLDNDTFNGGTVDVSLVIVSASNTDPASAIYIDTATGNVMVRPGTSTGTYTLTYTICEAAHPENCATATVTVGVLGNVELRVTKAASVKQVNIGDLVRYTLTVENNGDSPAVAASLVDIPAPGLTFVEGSLAVKDGDNAATVSGQNPIRFEGLDVAVGQTATVTYLMRVGAGARPGTLENRVEAFDNAGLSVSNVATAAVLLAADAMLEDSLIFGTVYHDRDGDGWQDSAVLSGVHVQGGFAADAYIAHSTTVDRGDGAQPEPDASSPMLHGIEIGRISGRTSAADPVQAHQVVISQRLKAPTFTDDFVLTNAQGVTVRMDAAGKTTVTTSGQAAKGLTAAAPTVERRVAEIDGGYRVDYVIGNAGIDEVGIPGVRIASVEGLLVETDQYGRYHLAGISGGDVGRGRNFILKVDPSTLPAGAVFSTDNPQLRRVTQGLPTRFDFGVSLPKEEDVDTRRQDVELELGEVIFEPGSARIREAFSPVVGKMAEQIQRHGGGEVVISADGASEAIAFERANALKQALLTQLTPSVASALKLSLRTDPHDPATLVAGIEGDSPVLGVVLFDTGRAEILPRYHALIDTIAAHLEQQGGGVVTVVGHADWRGDADANVALGLRRAAAVQDAIVTKLSPQLRSRVKVVSSHGPAAPAGTERD